MKASLFKIEIKKTKGGIDMILTNDESISFAKKLSSFKNMNELLSMLELIEKDQLSCCEYISSIDSFIRIKDKEVYFGQYIDDNIGELDEFKDFVDEGEKIFGVLSYNNFEPILLSWINYLEFHQGKSNLEI